MQLKERLIFITQNAGANPGKAKAYLISVGYTVYDGPLKPGVVRIYEPVRNHTVGHI